MATLRSTTESFKNSKALTNRKKGTQAFKEKIHVGTSGKTILVL